MAANRVLAMGLLWACAVAARAGGWSLGGSVGIMDADISGVDDATNSGILIGYDFFTRDIFAAVIEAEFTTTVSDGDLKAGGERGDWDIDTQAGYLAFRLGEEFYAKARFGFARTDISSSIGGQSFSGSDSGISWSAAAGWMFAEHWGVQADGTQVDSDITYWNLGLRYRF